MKVDVIVQIQVAIPKPNILIKIKYIKNYRLFLRCFFFLKTESDVYYGSFCRLFSKYNSYTGHTPSVRELNRMAWEMFWFVTTYYYYYFLACDWNPNGYTASASIIFVNHVLGNTSSMSRYILVLCIVISQCLHCTLVFFFRDPFPCSFKKLFFIKLKIFNHSYLECSSNQGCKSTDFFFERLSLGFCCYCYCIMQLCKGYTGLFNFYPFLTSILLNDIQVLESFYSSTANGNIWHCLFPHQTFAIFIDYLGDKGHF